MARAEDFNFSPDEAVTLEHQRSYEDKAKAGMLSPMEALYGQYLVYPYPGTQHVQTAVLYRLMFTLPADQATATHNWHMLRMMPAHTQHAWGPVVEKLRFPLFPPDRLQGLNEQIIDECRKGLLHGAGPLSGIVPVSHVFRREENEANLRGGSYYEPVYDASGTQTAAVLMDGTDQRFIELQNQMNAIQRELGRMAPLSCVVGRGAQPQRRQTARGRGYGYRAQWRGGANEQNPPYTGGGDIMNITKNEFGLI